MKEYEMGMVKRIILKKVICDDCKGECTNSYFDIQSKASFSEKSDLIKTICWKCYDKQFADKVREQFKSKLIMPKEEPCPKDIGLQVRK